jgi:hypothetical protein
LLPSLIVEGFIVGSRSGKAFLDSMGMLFIAGQQTKQGINSSEDILYTRMRYAW